MSITGLDIFDKALHTTNEWLKDLMYELNWNDRHQAFAAFRICAHALRDRLTVNEGAHLAAQLPLILKGVFYEGWKPADLPVRSVTRDTLLNSIRRYFEDRQKTDPETIARAVFKMLYHRIAEGEVEDIKQMLPDDLQDLWPHKMLKVQNM